MKDHELLELSFCALLNYPLTEGVAIQALRERLKQNEKQWVGLTDEEIKDAWSQLWHDLNNGKFAATDDPSRHTTVMFARVIEAKLKEKNA